MNNILLKLRYALLFVVSTVLAFFDINNHLNIGHADHNDFYPTNHGVFGNTLKVILSLIVLLSLIKTVRLFIKDNIVSTIVTIVIIVAIFFAAELISFDLYFTL